MNRESSSGHENIDRQGESAMTRDQNDQNDD